MEFSQEEFEQYVKNNYPVLFEGDLSGVENLPGNCNFCNREVFLKLYGKRYHNPYSSAFPLFEIFHLECPSCRRKSFIHAIAIYTTIEDENEDERDIVQHYRLFNLPEKEYQNELKDIPEEYELLRNCAREAMFCMAHSKYTSATIMFRRAIQIMAANILGAPKGTLARQLNWLKSNENRLKIDLTEVFHENSHIIKEIGNQGAHPEDEISLQDFTKEEMDLLHDLFQSTISEVFIKPALLKSIQDELKQRRRIK
ncbi:DUF4145 domain-containing protein [Robertkochia marina]|uniref:DUF4145 domain-containing protein n=1 Tax=Robertkochia marina TaxID=1227945 RepID=A0A4S3M0K1_9FLAO|nr:DUF4145 domain-containing protein [Robertkochia marina]THD66443.1 DUF4145 domain-containing protein [Robertkochia marina]TRZ44120.1 DUF4145 domain-containing protein [Robertkochia marina]